MGSRSPSSEAGFARFSGYDVGEVANGADFSVRSTEEFSEHGAMTEGFESDQAALMDSEYSYVPFEPYAYEPYVPYDEPWCSYMPYEPFVDQAPTHPEFFPPPTHTEWPWSSASSLSSSPSFVLREVSRNLRK